MQKPVRKLGGQQPKMKWQLEVHAARRAFQRFGFSIDIGVVAQFIRESKAELVEWQSNNRSIWRMLWAGVAIYPVYDKRRSTVCTILTQEMIDRHQALADKSTYSYGTGWGKVGTYATVLAEMGEI